GVADVGVAVLVGDRGGPGLHLPALHLHRGAARPAHQMVMVVLGAPPVQRFTGVGAQRVDQPGRRHRLQGAVHRGQADDLTAPAEFVVQFLSGSEVVDLVQQRRHRGPLPGGPEAGGSAHGSPSPAWLTAATTMSTRCSSTRRYITSRPDRSPATTPAAFRIRRCWLTSGCGTPSASTNSWTHRVAPRNCNTIAMRTGAASARSRSPAVSSTARGG